MYYVLLATALVGVVGIVIGLLLGVAGEKFKVEEDEREIAVEEILPGNNCGGCGYAGCSAMAKAIVAGEAPINGCPSCSQEIVTQISRILGVDSVATVRKAAFVKCAGTCDKTEVKFRYYGVEDCQGAMAAPGGGYKSCSWGCLGLGTCVKVCPFDAIHIVNGVAVVDRDECKACGKCVEACPKHVIEIMPYDAKYRVACSSHDKGKTVRTVCAAGCIGCGICVKQCEAGAVSLKDNLAYIDQEKCVGCGKCAEKCPAHAIISNVG